MSNFIIVGMVLAFLGQALVNLGLVLQKHGASRLPAIETTTIQANVKGFLKSGTWIIGMVLTGLGGLLNFIALSFAPLLVVQAFLAIGLAMLPFFSRMILNEPIEIRELFSVVITVLGILVLFYSLLEATLTIIDERILLDRFITLNSAIFHGFLFLSLFGAFIAMNIKKSNAGVFWGFVSGCSAGYAQILTRPFAVFFFRDVSSSVFTPLFWALMISILILQVLSIISLQLGFQKSKTSGVAIPYNVIAFLVPFFGSIFLLQEWSFSGIFQILGILLGVTLTLMGVSQLARRASVVPLPETILDLLD